jgi:DNA-binding LacI/PurR family transcriptional regulator
MTPAPEAAVTLSDVAARAGVSKATASRALAGRPRVSNETIARVQSVARELGYRVDPVARALRQGSTRLVGMIVPVIGIPFFAQLIDALEAELNRVGFELLLADSHGFVDEEIRRLQVFGDRRVDGILVIPSDRVESGRVLARTVVRAAVVEVDRATDGPIADFVGVDNEAGMRLVLDHLARVGVRSVGYAGSDDASSNGVERWDATQRVSSQLGIDVTSSFRGEFSVETGIAAVDRILAGRTLPDAIVAASDSIAVGVLRRLRERSVSVPEDVLVTGFDGSDLAAVVWPTLTTVVQPIEAIAADAVTFLRHRIDGETGPVRRNRLSPSLRLGESTRRR